MVPGVSLECVWEGEEGSYGEVEPLGYVSETATGKPSPLLGAAQPEPAVITPAMLEEEEQLEAAGLERERQMLEKVTGRRGRRFLPSAGVSGPPAGRALSCGPGPVLPGCLRCLSVRPGHVLWMNAAARRGGLALSSVVRENVTLLGWPFNVPGVDGECFS